MLTMMIVIGAAVGAVISALSHPLIYRGILGGRSQSADHPRNEGF